MVRPNTDNATDFLIFYLGSPELTFTHLTPSAEGGSSVTSAVIEDGKLFVGSLHSPELKFSPWNI